MHGDNHWKHDSLACLSAHPLQLREGLLKYKRRTSASRGGGVHTLNLLRRRYIGILCVGGEWVELNVLGHDDAVGERRITLARVAGRFNIEYTVRRSDALLQMTS